MIREILFKGKRIDNGEWIEGYYCPCVFGRFPCRPAIIIKEDMDNGHWHPVEIIPSTLRQYTGLTDKNGKKIFEGDILHFKAYRGGGFVCPIGTDIYYRVLFGHCNPDSDTLSEYVGFWALEKTYDEDDLYECGNSINYLVDSHGAYVIGNIHDNPELLRSDTE